MLTILHIIYGLLCHANTNQRSIQMLKLHKNFSTFHNKMLEKLRAVVFYCRKPLNFLRKEKDGNYSSMENCRISFCYMGSLPWNLQDGKMGSWQSDLMTLTIIASSSSPPPSSSFIFMQVLKKKWNHVREREGTCRKKPCVNP